MHSINLHLVSISLISEQVQLAALHSERTLQDSSSLQTQISAVEQEEETHVDFVQFSSKLNLESLGERAVSGRSSEEKVAVRTLRTRAFTSVRRIWKIKLKGSPYFNPASALIGIENSISPITELSKF